MPTTEELTKQFAGLRSCKQILENKKIEVITRLNTATEDFKTELTALAKEHKTRNLQAVQDLVEVKKQEVASRLSELSLKLKSFDTDASSVEVDDV